MKEKLSKQYRLLEKLEYDIYFYKEYHKYVLLAQKYTKDKKELSQKSHIYCPYNTASFYSYIKFKVVPFTQFITKNRSRIFESQTKNESDLLDYIKHEASYMLKIDSDEEVIGSVLLFCETWNELLSKSVLLENLKIELIEEMILLPLRLIESLLNQEIQKTTDTDTLSQMISYDVEGHVEFMRRIAYENPRFTTRDTSSIKYDLYESVSHSKNEAMQPIHIFQNKVKELAEVPSKDSLVKIKIKKTHKGYEITINEQHKMDVSRKKSWDLLYTLRQSRPDPIDIDYNNRNIASNTNKTSNPLIKKILEVTQMKKVHIFKTKDKQIHISDDIQLI